MLKSPRVTVFSENPQEHQGGKAAEIYPDGLHAPIVGSLEDMGLLVRTATQDEPQHGLSVQSLKDTDVLLWWGHQNHER